MAKVEHTCTGCVPIDASIIDVYVTLVETNKAVTNAEAVRTEAEAARVLAETQRTSTFATDHNRAVADQAIAQSDHATAGTDHTSTVAATESANAAAALANEKAELVQEAVGAAFTAANRANDAADAAEHMVDIHQGPPGPSGIAPIIGENGHWWTWNDETEQYEDTGEDAQGPQGIPGPTPDISIGEVTTVEPGTPAGANMTGTPEAPVLNLSIPQGQQGQQGLGFDAINTPQTADGTMVIRLSDGNTITVDMNHDHPQYPKYQLCEDEAAYMAITTKDSATLYLIPEV